MVKILSSIDNTSMITVLNYMPCSIIVNSNVTSYKFEPCTNGVPSVQIIPYSEIKVVNSTSNIFREGYLFFEHENKKELYESLGIKEWQLILSQEDIENIILNPTKEGLQRLINVKTVSYFERIRGVFSKLRKSGTYDISIRAQNIIEMRYKELRSGVINTKILINPIASSAIDDSIDALKEQIEELKMQLSKINNIQQNKDEKSPNIETSTPGLKRSKSKKVQ